MIEPVALRWMHPPLQGKKAPTYENFGVFLIADLCTAAGLNPVCVGGVAIYRHGGRIRYAPRLIDKRGQTTVGVSGPKPYYSLPSDAMGILEAEVRRQLERAIACRFCGDLTMPWHTRALHPEQEGCWGCREWISSLRKATTKLASFIVGGELHEIGQEFPRKNSGMRGFGGRPYLVQFDDGRQIYSTNIWFQGEIPRHFRYLGRDDAEWRCMWDYQQSNERMQELPECNCGALPFPHVCVPWKLREDPVPGFLTARTCAGMAVRAIIGTAFAGGRRHE